MQYGAFTKAILEYLADSGKSAIEAFFDPNHPSRKYTRTVLAAYDTRYSSSRSAAKHALSSTLYRLKKQGLVACSGPKKKTAWTITRDGRKFLRKAPLRQPRNVYALEPEDGAARLVTFDIPEKEKKNRQWLHAELLACGFPQLHKSVFVGTRPLPSEFIRSLNDRRLTSYIHIVGIEKSGTLEKK